jgi:putative N6-adenine-specific DNA methylase
MSSVELDVLGSRGALKLRAALETLGLGARVQGLAAIDIGASTGGFTAVLLERGARSVTAIDVGHGQLAESLRHDARVTLLEKTDFKRASLDVAEGPFGFFCVDVSFVAARNMLRSLAFRLEPGSSGMLLLKPQFELSKRELRGRSVAEPALRARALELLRERAVRCGFRVIEARDSAVPGESGTVEIVVHMAFDGRPESWPIKADEDEPGGPVRVKAEASSAKPSAPRAARGPAPPKDAASIEHEWFAIAAPGLEPLLGAELSALASNAPVRQVRVEQGGVVFRGPLAAGYAANLGCRLATRVLVRVGEVKVRELPMLRRKLRELPFERFIAPGATLRVVASAQRCRIYHTGALAENLELAIGDRLRAPIVRAQTAVEDEDAPASSELPFGREPFGRVLLRGQDDLLVVSVDSSGLLLHRRGGRPEAGVAPLRETLAAAVLRHAGYDGSQPLIDAMCGSGTFALEAAGIALGVLPGGARAFALETFPGVDAALFEQERARLTAALASPLRAPIHAFDRDSDMIALAKRNAERSGVAEHVVFRQLDLREAKPPTDTGLLVANPPYGKRLGRPDEIKRRYRSIGDALRASWQGFRIALLVPRETPPVLFGLDVEQRVPLVNGGVPVMLLIGRPQR